MTDLCLTCPPARGQVPFSGNARTGFAYAAYGLSFASELALPGLLPSASVQTPDAVLSRGVVPERLDRPLATGARYQASRTALLFWLEGIGRFLVEDGKTIRVQEAAGASDQTLAELVLTSPLAGLLLQRSLLALHASAVLIGNRAVLFAGPSGAGKSVLAALFRRRGFTVLADDISVVRPSERGWVVEPGELRLKVPRPAFDAVKRAEDAFELVRPGAHKVKLSTVGDRPPGRQSLERLYLLNQENRESPVIKSVDPSWREAAILRQVYRAELGQPLGLRQAWQRQAAELSRSLPIQRALCPRGIDRLEALADLIVADASASQP